MNPIEAEDYAEWCAEQDDLDREIIKRCEEDEEDFIRQCCPYYREYPAELEKDR